MEDPNFWDFVLEGGWELLFPEDEEGSIECSACGRVIRGNEKVEWTDKKKKTFKCPNCKDLIQAE